MPKKKAVLTKTIIVVILVVGFVTVFVLGFLLSNLLSLEKPFIPEPSSLPQASNNPSDKILSTFLPGKHYFDDTVILITKNEPHLALVATVARQEQEVGFIQNSHVSYFDGTNWAQNTVSRTNTSLGVEADQQVRTWSINTDPTRVLKETISGEIISEGDSILFATNTLTNEISVRSLPGYTKFMSKGEGTLTINGKPHQAYLLYSRIYSLNALDIQFYNQPLGLTTDWITFWDSQGNFYHVDMTEVEKPTPIYQTHQFAVFEDSSGSVTKTFGVSIDRGSAIPPSNYTVRLEAPLQASLQFNRLNQINKGPNNSYNWFVGTIKGSVTKNGSVLTGVGLVEYIHN